ncbi:formate dehydrogenase formation protein [Propionispira arboris]|uniref:Formate dehydrogenase formation protein n=1 Tax=Propionispira arboris TaxID=84035 RepID=A0A1H6XU82_9FIRM|nr:formate dehydrogenase accessory protein FdhE [Propionispira arboris]SEJ30327.1 formate dehydrogenase formation protein [Propionispira arboris]
MISFESFGEKYPFLKENLPFWQKYQQARQAIFKLMPQFIDIEKLKQTDFLEHMDQKKPFLAYQNVFITAQDSERLIQVFCEVMGLKNRKLVFLEQIPMFEDLNIEADEAGFIVAEVHAGIAAFIGQKLNELQTPVNWLENRCHICGAPAGMGIIDEKGKKELVCSHCHSVWRYIRTCCGICGNLEERGSTFVTADEAPNWLIELCDKCHGSLKVCDMRNSQPDIIMYPLHYLTTWQLDLAVQDRGYEPAMFWIFERAGWLE